MSLRPPSGAIGQGTEKAPNAEVRMGKIQDLSSKASIIREFLGFLWERKLWWMIPMFLVFLTIGLLLVFAQGSALAPFIYTLF